MFHAFHGQVNNEDTNKVIQQKDIEFPNYSVIE